MSAGELIRYLQGFPENERVGVLAVNLKTRQAYQIDAYQLMTDAGFPVLLFELGTPDPLDDVVEVDSQP